MAGHVSRCASEGPPARKSRVQKGWEAVIYTRIPEGRMKGRAKNVSYMREENEREGERERKRRPKEKTSTGRIFVITDY